MKHSRMMLVGLLGLALAIVACGPQTSGSPARSSGSTGASSSLSGPVTINVVLVGEPRALTVWQESTTGGVVNIHELMTTGLVTLNANSEPIPRLAEEVPSV